jgi:hypothetical protein
VLPGCAGGPPSKSFENLATRARLWTWVIGAIVLAATAAVTLMTGIAGFLGGNLGQAPLFQLIPAMLIATASTAWRRKGTVGGKPGERRVHLYVSAQPRSHARRFRSHPRNLAPSRLCRSVHLVYWWHGITATMGKEVSHRACRPKGSDTRRPSGRESYKRRRVGHLISRREDDVFVLGGLWTKANSECWNVSGESGFNRLGRAGSAFLFLRGSLGRRGRKEPSTQLDHH